MRKVSTANQLNEGHAANGNNWWILGRLLQVAQNSKAAILRTSATDYLLLDSDIVALIKINHIWWVERLFERPGDDHEFVVQFRSPEQKLVASG